MPKLPKSVGFGMGLEFRESTCLLNAKNAALAKPGMVFNVSVGALWCSDCDHVQESSWSAQKLLPDQHTIPRLANGLSEAETQQSHPWNSIGFSGCQDLLGADPEMQMCVFHCSRMRLHAL